MDDQRGITFGIQWAINTAPLDETKQKEKAAQEEAKKTAQELEKIGVNLSDIGTHAGSAFGKVKGASADMGSTIRGAMLQSIKQGDSLGRTLNVGIGAAIGNIGAKVKGFGAAAKSVFRDIGQAVSHPIQTIKAGLGNAFNSAGTAAKESGKKARDAAEDYEQMGTRGTAGANTLINALKRIGIAAAALLLLKTGVQAIGDFGQAAVTAAATAEETQSKFEVVFGGSATGAQQWVDSFADAAKRSSHEVQGFMADAQAMMKGLGMSESAGAEMSKTITSLSYDLASFHNISDSDAFTKIRSGMMGETEGLKSLGIVMSEATIQQAMLASGYKGNESALRKQWDAMTEAEKAQMRLNVIVAQSGDALTDVTRTSDSYTNSLKGIKGMWADFLADAGAKFTPALTGLFNSLLEAWPRIEPALMGLVDLLSNGLSTAVPILLELGNTLLPIFTDALGIIFQVLQPLMPVFGALVRTLLPPLLGIIGQLATVLLPPLVQILDVINTSILQPLMPVFTQLVQMLLPPFAQILGMIAPLLQVIAPVLGVIQPIIGLIGDILMAVMPVISVLAQAILPVIAQVITIITPIMLQVAQTILPPIAQLLGLLAPILQLIAPLLQAIAPVVQFLGQVLKVVADVIGAIISWVADGVGKVVDFFSALFGGAKEANTETAKLADTMADVTAPETPTYTTSEIPVMEMPEVTLPPITLDTTQAQMGMQDINKAGAETYQAVTASNSDAWTQMGTDAQTGADGVILQFRRIKDAASQIGSVAITANVTATDVPGFARGGRTPGGWVRMNEEGGEMAYLPGGTTIVPADKSEQLISRGGGKTLVFSPHVEIEISGTATEADKQEMEARMRAVMRDEYERLKRAEAEEEAIQEGIA